MTKISDKSVDNQSEGRISVTCMNKNCHLSLMKSFVKRPPEGQSPRLTVGREGGRTPFILGDPAADPPSMRPVGCWPAPDAAAACIVLKDQRKSLTKHSLDVPNTVVDCFYENKPWNHSGEAPVIIPSRKFAASKPFPVSKRP